MNNTLIGLPYRSDNIYENILRSSVKFVGVKKNKTNKIKILKDTQYTITKKKGVEYVSITDGSLKLGSLDMIFIEG